MWFFHTKNIEMLFKCKKAGFLSAFSFFCAIIESDCKKGRVFYEI